MAKVLIKESVAEFSANAESTTKIRAFIRDRLLETPLVKKDITGLLLAVEEAVANIIRHGYLHGPGDIRLRVAHDRRGVVIALVDRGRFFERPRKGSVDYQKMIATSRKGGLGIMLIDRICDRVDYRRTAADENELVLFKKFPTTSRFEWGLSLRWKWALASMVLSTVIAGVFYLVATDYSAGSIRQSYYERWLSLGSTAASTSANLILNQATDVEFDELALNLARQDPAIVQLVITDRRGLILADTRLPENVRTPYTPPVEIKNNGEAQTTPIRIGRTTGYYLRLPIGVQRRRLGWIHLSADGRVITTAHQAQRDEIARYAFGGMIVLWLCSILLSGWFVRPLKKLFGSLPGSAGQKFDQALTVNRGDEIKNIVTAFNSATSQIHDAERTHYSRELARREWEAAEQLQKALVMTTPPEVPGFAIGTLYRSAKYVGGDWSDVFPLNDETFAVAVADVSGKGIPGALVMAAVRTALRLLSEKHRDPATLLAAVNDFAAGNIQAGMFVTMFLAMINTKTETVRFASAGHLPMLFYRASEKRVFELNPRGWPLGMQLPEGVSFAQRLEAGNLPFTQGDSFLLYTDGLSEARNTEKEFFGIQRLNKILQAKHAQPASQIVAALDAELAEFVGDDTVQDDMAAVVVKRLVGVATGLANSFPGSPPEEKQSPAAERWLSERADSPTRRLLQVVAHRPEYDPPQICLELDREAFDVSTLDEKTVRRELIHLRLDDRQNRRVFAEWVHAQNENQTYPDKN